MSEQQPDVRWAPIPPRPSRRGRNWLIVGLVLAGLLIAAVLLFFLVPRGDSPEPGASGTPSPSASPTGTSTPTPAASPTSEPTPITTPPPVADPSVGAFRDQVRPWLDDAVTGLDIVSDSSGQEALAVVDTLQQDAQRLSDAQPPGSIEPQWRDGVSGYAARLAELRSALSSGTDDASALEDARTSLQSLHTIVGL